MVVSIFDKVVEDILFHARKLASNTTPEDLMDGPIRLKGFLESAGCEPTQRNLEMIGSGLFGEFLDETHAIAQVNFTDIDGVSLIKLHLVEFDPLEAEDENRIIH